MRSITRPETPLKRVLQEQGRMQKWLAEQVGCHPSEISDYCRGVHMPADAKRHAIAQALGRSEAELFDQETAHA